MAEIMAEEFDLITAFRAIRMRPSACWISAANEAAKPTAAFGQANLAREGQDWAQSGHLN